MTVRAGLPAKLAANDASDTRYDFRNLAVRNADGTVRPGVTGPAVATQALVAATASTGPMTVTVAAFDAVAARDGGVVLLSNDGVVTVPMPAAPQANSQINVVYAMQHDSSSTVSVRDADDLPGIYVSAGQPSAGQPVKPSIPAGAVELATVQVPSTATATNSANVVITQTFQYTAMAGGVVPFPTASLLLAWANPRDGQRAWALDTSQLYTYMANASTPGWKLAGGKASIGAFTPQGIYLAGGTTPQVVQQADLARLEGKVTSSSATFVAGTSYTIGSIPAAFAPSATVDLLATSNISAVAQVSITSTGSIVMVLNVTFTGALNLSLASCQPWRMKGY